MSNNPKLGKVMRMAINKEEAARDYVERASTSGDKLVRKYTAVSNKLAKSTSENAQKSYEMAMKDPAVLERRRKNLAKLSEEDLNKAMLATGATTYSTKVSASGDKWRNNVSPYLEVLDRVTDTLPARTRDAKTNIMNRVVPVATALESKKKEIG